MLECHMQVPLAGAVSQRARLRKYLVRPPMGSAVTDLIPMEPRRADLGLVLIRVTGTTPLRRLLRSLYSRLAARHASSFVGSSGFRLMSPIVITAH